MFCEDENCLLLVTNFAKVDNCHTLLCIITVEGGKNILSTRHHGPRPRQADDTRCQLPVVQVRLQLH